MSDSGMGINSETQLNRKYIEFMKLLNIYLNHFPKFEKYALSNKIRNTSYELYDLITEGEKRYYKKTTLTNLDITHQRLRMQIYLANELGYFHFKNGKDTNLEKEAGHRFITLSNYVDEIGKMIGAWIGKVKGDNQWN